MHLVIVFCVNVNMLVRALKLHSSGLTAYRCLHIVLVHSLRLTVEAIRQLGVCWNDAFCKIFNYSRMESVKLLQ